MKTLFLILTVTLIFLTGCSNSNSNFSSYNAEKQSTTNHVASTPSEFKLNSFSTTIYTKTENRQNNVKLCCSQLNGITVAPGETFSFCNTLRPC